MPGQASTRVAKIGLIAAILAIVAAAVTWEQIVRFPEKTSPSTDRNSLLVLEHGGTLPSRSPARRQPDLAPRTRPPADSPPTPPSPAERRRPTPPSREDHRARSRTYLVREGDSLYRIAANLYGEPERWPEIASANDLAEPYWIREGETLRIP